MSDTKLGQLIGPEAQRDAIHIAIAPVIAGCTIKPGDHIGFDDDGEVSLFADNKIGIADPFLKAPVRQGERFYMFLYPQTVTGMRHEWQHPAFPSPAPLSDYEAERSLKAMAERCGCSFERLMERLGYYAEGSCGPDDAIQEDGTKVDEKIKGNTYFRCAC